MNNNITDFKKEDLENVANDYINEKQHPPTEKKIAYVLGGQPGAGKSSLLGKAKVELSRNVVIINADDFRARHPNYKEIVEKYGAESSKYTGNFSGNTAEKVIDYAIERNQNLAIEGTFRTSDIPIRTLQKLKKHGYETRVEIVTTDKNESYQSTLDRYNDAINSVDPEERLTARLTPKQHHDDVVKGLPGNVKTVLESDLADRFVVSSREGLIYDKDNSLLNYHDVDESVYIQANQNEIRQEFNEHLSAMLNQQLEQNIKLEDKNIQQKTLEDISTHADEIAKGRWENDNTDEAYIDTENAELNTYLNNIKDPAARSRLMTVIQDHQKYADRIFDRAEMLPTRTLKQIGDIGINPVKYIGDMTDQDVKNIKITKDYFADKGYEKEAFFIGPGRENANYRGYVGETRDNCQMLISKDSGSIFALDVTKLSDNFNYKKGELVTIKNYATPQVVVTTEKAAATKDEPTSLPKTS